MEGNTMKIRINEKTALEKLPFSGRDSEGNFYEINNKVYFGELTFFPASGMGEFVPIKWDYKLGEMIKLPIK